MNSTSVLSLDSESEGTEVFDDGIEVSDDEIVIGGGEDRETVENWE